MNKTLSIIKPDATKRNITGSINKIIEDNGLRIIAQKRIILSDEQAKEFYKVHNDKPFFNDLIKILKKNYNNLEIAIAPGPTEINESKKS